jgi:hypothetical protein
MSASNDFEADILKLIFNNTAIANIGDAPGILGSAAAGSLYVALHTADPGEAGTQATSEATYTGYARVAVARSGAGWTVSGTAPTQVVNAAAVTFGLCTAGSETITHFSVGYQSAGATKMVDPGVLNASLAVSAGITPAFSAGQLTITCD